MARFQTRRVVEKQEKAYNPFEVVDNSQALKSSLNEIDSRSIRCQFKATQDPIQYVFDSFDNTSLKTLAADFVKESFTDIVSFISNVINN